MPNLLSDMYDLDKKDENVGKEFLLANILVDYLNMVES